MTAYIDPGLAENLGTGNRYFIHANLAVSAGDDEDVERTTGRFVADYIGDGIVGGKAQSPAGAEIFYFDSKPGKQFVVFLANKESVEAIKKLPEVVSMRIASPTEIASVVNFRHKLHPTPGTRRAPESLHL